jgi:hypothetical protein
MLAAIAGVTRIPLPRTESTYMNMPSRSLMLFFRERGSETKATTEFCAHRLFD